MKISWTDEQQQVIALRNRNILVSAAAGSGKTAVLVERILSMITDPKHPVDVDRLLIVTFTRAAAGEMKERLIRALEKRLEEMPEDEHLQQQCTLVHHALITTIDGFCAYVVKNYFYRIDLDPAFRMMEEGESRLLRTDVVQRVLEEAYVEADGEFLNFVESFASGKDDEKLAEFLLNLYDFSQSYPYPQEWLTACVTQYEVKTPEELADCAWMKKLEQFSQRELLAAISLLEQAAVISGEPEGPYMYLPMLEEELLAVQKIAGADTYGARCAQLAKLKFQRLSTKKDDAVDLKLREKVKALRDDAKEILAGLQEMYVLPDEAALLEQLAGCQKHVKVLVALTLKFAQEFSAQKRSKNLLDFSDLEHFALDILMERQDGELVPTAAAAELSERFYEIMIDEYQDSNYVQEMLLNSVSRIAAGVHNVFMVGDVKQSIYRFRQARPELFLEKYHRYTKEDSKEQKIDLHRNFRSRRQVLAGANYIFRRIMTEELGGIAYDDAAALYPGAAYPDGVQDAATEVLLLRTDSELLEDERSRETARELEARAIGNRIRELVGQEPVLDKESGEYRPAQYKDCVILLRATTGWAETFAQVLNGMGIPAYSASKTGYFSALEVVTVLNYLNICDNPRQEIPFTAVLYSPIGGCSARELAVMKAAAGELPIYEACRWYAANGEEHSLREKLEKFLALLDELRGCVGYTPVHELVELVLERTGYGSYAAAMPGGEQREANLKMLVEQAIAFEGTSYRGLFNFIRYIEKLQKYQVDYGEVSVTGENADTVRIMSIHKSKGLEFPVVFVAGMGKRFNQQDSRQMLVLHSGLGVGMDEVDPLMRTKRATLPKQIIKRELKLESLAEELRILYVALTRAKERLILTGTIGNPEKTVRACANYTGRKETALPARVLENASGYWDWILPALLAHPAFLPLYKEYGAAVSTAETFAEENAAFSIREVRVEQRYRRRY